MRGLVFRRWRIKEDVMKTQKAALSLVPQGRVGRLRDLIINAPQEVCIERARYLTQAMNEHWDENPLIRMSSALEYILNHISVIIREDELIVGCRTSKL
jgi:formate C-acetyltransferase